MVTWLYTVIDNESVRVRYDLRRNVIDWRTLEQYTEPPLRTVIRKTALTNAERCKRYRSRKTTSDFRLKSS